MSNKKKGAEGSAVSPSVPSAPQLPKPLETLLLLPFAVLRCPNLKLKQPNWEWRPTPMMVFSGIFVSYFLILSGVMYDIIIEPPSLGQTVDVRTGTVRPVAFLQGKVNGQYIIEGLTAGFLFSCGGLGFILLDVAHTTAKSRNNESLSIILGFIIILVSYTLCQWFIRMKVPHYMLERD